MTAAIDTNFPTPQPSTYLFGKEAVALVTGGNRGLGLQTVLGLAKRGITVVMGARDVKKGADAAAPALAEGLKVDVVELDGTNQSTIDAAVAYITSTYGKLDILVNNAGVVGCVFGTVAGMDESPEMLRDVYEVNVIAPFQIVKACLPLLKLSDHGRVVNVSSGAGSLTFMSSSNVPLPPMFAYTSSKTALNMITVQLARDLAKFNIKVNATNPGWCATDLSGNTGPRTAEQGAQVTINLATMNDDGPSGSFFNDSGRIFW